MSRWRRTGLAVAALLVGGTCAIPTESVPEALPGGVVSPVHDAPGEGTPSPSPPATVFLVRAGCVVPVERTLPRPDLDATLARLLDGPLEDEVAAGFRTAMPPGTELLSVRRVDGTAHIDLSGAFVEVAGEEQILAVAQLVLTATGVPGIERARFALEGSSVEVPTADGTLVPGPLTADDYAAIRVGCVPGT
jgi:spore germination protein GerM